MYKVAPELVLDVVNALEISSGENIATRADMKIIGKINLFISSIKRKADLR